MTIEERLAHLAEHGVGCPQAVKLGGPASIEAWAEQQEVTLEAALADAEAADAADAEAVDARTEEAARVRADTEERAAAAVEGAGGPEAVETTLTGERGEPAEDVLERLGVLERAVEGLAKAVDALAVSGPTEEAVGAVAASPEPEAKPKGGKKGKGK